MPVEFGFGGLGAGLAHSRVERIGCDAVRRLRRALEIDFAVAGNIRIRPGIRLRQKRESGLTCRETRLLRVEVLGLPEWNERIDRAGIGGEVATAVDRCEIDPAARREGDALEANLADRTGIENGWLGLVGARRRDGR